VIDFVKKIIDNINAEAGLDVGEKTYKAMYINVPMHLLYPGQFNHIIEGIKRPFQIINEAIKEELSYETDREIEYMMEISYNSDTYTIFMANDRVIHYWQKPIWELRFGSKKEMNKFMNCIYDDAISRLQSIDREVAGSGREIQQKV
jgi:hypothetical protein